MTNIDITKLLSAIGGFAGIFAFFEFVINFAKILDWFKDLSSILKKNSRKKTTDNGEPLKHLAEVQNNLPSSGTLIGRRKLIKKICKSIDTNTLTMIVGVGGIGKSSLVLEAVKTYYLKRRRRHFRFDAIVWTTAKNNNLTFPDFLDTVARVMEYTGILQITNIEERELEVLHLFQKNRILLIIDNFETVTDQRIAAFLEKVCDNDRVIITSRKNEAWAISSSTIHVDKLEEEEGIALVKYEYRKQNLNFKDVSNESLLELLSTTSGSPLAIKWAVGQVATTRLPIERIMAFLKKGHGDVLEKMFSSSWLSLDSNSQTLLYFILFFSPSASRDALFQVSKLDELSFDVCIGKLCSLSLIETSGNNIHNQRYSLHSLTRTFIEKMKSAECTEDFVFYKNVIEYYNVFCINNGEKGTIESYDNIQNEISNILKTVNLAKPYAEYSSLVINIITSISVFLWNRGYWDLRISLSGIATELSLSVGDNKLAILHQYIQGIVLFWQGNIAEALNCVKLCKKYLNDEYYSVGEALILRLEALIQMDSCENSIEKFKIVLNMLQNSSNDEIRIFADWRVDSENGYLAGIVALYQEIGITYNRNTKYSEAIDWLNKSLELAEQIYDIEGQAISCSHLGFAYIGKQDYDAAKRMFKKGLEYALSVNRNSTIGRCYHGLAISESKRHRHGKTKKYANEACFMFKKLGMLKELEQINSLLN